MNDQIKKLQAEQQELQKKKAQADEESTKLFNEADQASGQKSVDLFTQASDLRKTASDTLIQIDGVSAKLKPLQQQLEVAQQQLIALKNEKDQNGAIPDLQKQMNELTNGWKNVQQQIDAEVALSATLLGSAVTVKDPASSPPPAPAPGPRPRRRPPLIRSPSLVQT